MITNRDSYAMTGIGRAAASARLLLAAPPSWVFGAELCLQRDERFAGTPATPTSVARLRHDAGDAPAMKINKFEFQSVPGSTVWRPPV